MHSPTPSQWKGSNADEGHAAVKCASNRDAEGRKERHSAGVLRRLARTEAIHVVCGSLRAVFSIFCSAVCMGRVFVLGGRGRASRVGMTSWDVESMFQHSFFTTEPYRPLFANVLIRTSHSRVP